MSERHIENLLEASLLAAGRALKIDDLMKPFLAGSLTPDRSELRAGLVRLAESLNGRGIELVEVASGFRLQVRADFSSHISALFSERPPRYSRALLETLALIAYRQPITRGEIEDIRGVAVSTNVIRTLLEREWVRVLGYKEVPGRPALYGSTATFLDYFGLKSLDQLPPLADLRDPDLPAGDLFAPVEIQASDQTQDEQLQPLPVLDSPPVSEPPPLLDSNESQAAEEPEFEDSIGGPSQHEMASGTEPADGSDSQSPDTQTESSEDALVTKDVGTNA